MSTDGTWGQFWLPETPSEKRYGLLDIEADGEIILHFGGDFTVGYEDVEPTADNPAGFNWLTEDDGVPEVVHGWLNRSPKAVTLLHCTTTHRNVVRQGLLDGSEQTIKPLFGFRGAHLDKEAKFTAFMTRCQGIDAWSNLELLEVDRSTSISMVNIVPSTIIPATLAEGGSITLNPELVTSGDHKGVHIQQRTWLAAFELTASEWRGIDRRFITPLQTLLTLCIGKEALITDVRYLTEKGPVQALGKGSNNPDEPLASLQPAEVPIPFDIVGSRGLAEWLDLAETMGPLPPIVAKSVGSNENGTMESQVIELTSVAEGLHKRLINASRRVRYRTRVAELAERAELALPGVCGVSERWASLIVDARNEYVHRQNDFLGPSGAIDTLLVLVKSLRFALRAFLLTYAGISDTMIASALSATSEWMIFREQARETLPDVYTS